MKPIKFLRSTLMFILSTVLLAGLSVYTWAGFFSRLWADDYCYSAVVQSQGIFSGTIYWYQVGGNRFSALWGVGLSDLFGPAVTAWLPGVMILLWVIAWVFTITHLAQRLGWHPRAEWALLAALVLVYFNLLMAPHILQSLFWRMGMLHYTLPLILFLFNLGLLARAWPKQDDPYRRLLPTAVGCALLAFVAAGLSETYVAFQTGALLVGLGLAIILVSPSMRLRVFALLAPALVLSLLAMGIMALSPANAWRQALLPPPTHIGELITYTLRFSMEFIIDSLRTLPLPGLVFGVLFFGFGLAAGQPTDKGLNKRGMAASIILILSLGFGLVVCAIAPSAYAGLQYPAERALTVARFAFLIAIGFAAFIGGCLTRELGPRNLRMVVTPAVLLILLAGSLYVLQSLTYPVNEGQVLQARAQRWDARHELILGARANGMKVLSVQEVDVVTSLEDIGPDPDHWVNHCVAQYYRLDSITALP